MAERDLISPQIPLVSPRRSAFVKRDEVSDVADRTTNRTTDYMFEEHARALRYLAWLAAGLFPFGVIIESLKQGGAEPPSIYGLLGLIGVLCMAICHGEWRRDNALARPPRGRR